MQIEQVRRIPYFQDLDARLLERVRAAMFEVQATKEQLLIMEGEPAEARYGVSVGQVKIFKNEAAGNGSPHGFSFYRQ